MFTYISMLVMICMTMIPSRSTRGGSLLLHGLDPVLHVQDRHVRVRARLEDDQIVASPALVAAETM